MTASVGIGLAFVAMLCWGFGDFLIQKSTRKLGDWETLFVISLFGVLVLLPFVWKSIPGVLMGSLGNILILSAASVVILLAALIDFEALRKGKFAIVEPIWSLEVPVAALLAFFLLNERISVFQIVSIIALLVCLMMVSFREKSFSKSLLMEKGALLAVIGAMIMGCSNFLMGWGGRVTDPLFVNFFTNVFLTLATLLFLIVSGRMNRVWGDIKHGYGYLLPMALFDNIAWIAYVFAMNLSSIAVVTALSESYIIITVLLGLFINKEKIQKHQKVGLVGAIIFAIVLAATTG
ncbi:MAG: DMT family transporter [Candidatus Taylorbacteria bacterium]|nr:DMT family transporter [Candidatus Taylorbacteria bacterium]